MSVNKKLNYLERFINKKFHDKYYLDSNFYNITKIENIIYNDKTNLVSKFKDQIISNDIFEFFIKFYSLNESISLYIKCLSYYGKNFIFYPNYACLPESKYIFQNINNKKLLIIEGKNDDDFNKNININNDKKIFDNSVYNSIMKGSNLSTFGIKNINETIYSIKDINNLINEIGKNNDKDNFNDKYYNNAENDFEYEDNKKIIKFLDKNNLIKKEDNFSSVYIKSNIKKKILNNLINKRPFIYKKNISDLKNKSTSFSIKKINLNNEKDLKNIRPIKNQSPIKYEKNNLKKGFFSKNNQSKTFCKNGVKKNKINSKIISNENISPIKRKKTHLYNSRINTEVNVGYQSKAFFTCMPKENTIYIFNNNCISKQNLNFNYKKTEPKMNNKFIDFNKRIIISKKKKDKTDICLTTKKKRCINSIIDSIRKKIKKESKNNISQRILDLMSKDKDLKQKIIHKDLNKHTKSLKEFMKFNNEIKKNKNLIRNKLLLSLEKSNTNDQSYKNSFISDYKFKKPNYINNRNDDKEKSKINNSLFTPNYSNNKRNLYFNIVNTTKKYIP